MTFPFWLKDLEEIEKNPIKVILPANSFVLFMGHLIQHSHSNKHEHSSRRRKNEDTRAHLEIIKSSNPLHPKGCDMTPLHTSDPLRNNEK
ncbi:14059_t:CDS:2 [Acaulospora morrowiae]|uniref:14059_t:CDS:1 n=1 Tax=Acaulospora morrowiae TaxID=94023 RepID=A0A9N9ATS5_9GLOM|nr:14059_t:CDS:2 [Acaulospora morrowiae]